MWGQLSTTCSNVLKQPNGELPVAVNHNQLRTMASERVDAIDWSHLPPSWAVSPELHVHSINQCNLSGTRMCNRSMRGNHLAYVATQGINVQAGQAGFTGGRMLEENMFIVRYCIEETFRLGNARATLDKQSCVITSTLFEMNSTCMCWCDLNFSCLLTSITSAEVSSCQSKQTKVSKSNMADRVYISCLQTCIL